MDAFVQLVLEFLSACGGEERTVEALKAHYVELIGFAGITRFIMAALPQPRGPAHLTVLMDDMPRGWLTHYDAVGYLADDPVVRRSRAAHRPFTWKEARVGAAVTGLSRRLEGEAREIGLVDGIAFPIPASTTGGAMVGLATDRVCELPPENRWLLYIASLACQTAASSLGGEGRSAPALPPLSGRERDVLTWLAHGKTQREISTILGITDRTTEFHVEHARRKLEATTTVQAVARAIYHGSLKL